MKKIWEFQHKSLSIGETILTDDPPPFVSRDKQKLNNLNQYKLNPTFIRYQPKENNNNSNHNNNEWMIQIADNIQPIHKDGFIVIISIKKMEQKSIFLITFMLKDVEQKSKKTLYLK